MSDCLDYQEFAPVFVFVFFFDIRHVYLPHTGIESAHQPDTLRGLWVVGLRCPNGLGLHHVYANLHKNLKCLSQGGRLAERAQC
jgi:hypothetical protein